MADISSQATTQDIYIDRGERAVFLCTLVDGDASAIDITSHTVVFLVWDAAGAEVVELSNSTGEHTTPASGTTTFALESAITDNASATHDTEWRYSVHWKSDGTAEDIATYGKIYVRAVPFSAIA